MTVKYNNLDAAIAACLETSKQAEIVNGTSVIYLGKTDLTSAFRVLPMKRKCFCLLVFKATDPSDGKVKYFIDKCLPFGASLSCSHYQRFSNSLRHILRYRTGRKTINNYLDDFLFIAISHLICNGMINSFLQLCFELNLPVAEEKTEWASTLVILLGILLDDEHLILSIPIDKRDKALNLLNNLTGKRRIEVKQLQRLTGYLNFLAKAIFAGHTFTRCIYAKYAKLGAKLKPHHHIAIDNELRFDCEIRQFFLNNFQEKVLCRPMVDLDQLISAQELNFYSDASTNHRLGMGAIYDNRWLYTQWEENYVKYFNPSIEYLELLGVVSAILTWGDLIQNQRIVIFCDNQAVVSMINTMSSSCKNCMYLLRLLILNNLIFNRRVFARYVRSTKNDFADSLSHLQLVRFWSLVKKSGRKVNKFPTEFCH